MTQLDEKPTAEQEKGRQHRWAYVLAAVIAVAVLIGVGAVIANNGESDVPPKVSPQPAPEVVPTTVSVKADLALAVTAENLAGVWTNGGFLMDIDGQRLFQTWGTGSEQKPFIELASVDGLLTSGSFVLDGSNVTFRSDGFGLYCEAGATATFKISDLTDQTMTLATVSDAPCQPQRGTGSRFSPDWTRVADPVSPAELPLEEAIVGLYGRDPTGMLQIRPDGTLRIGRLQHGLEAFHDYAWEEAGTDTSGTYLLDGDVLTFTADATDALCGEGAQATMTVTVHPRTMRFTGVTEDSCFNVEAFGSQFEGMWSRGDMSDLAEWGTIQ